MKTAAVNPYEALGQLRKTHALVAEIDHVLRSQPDADAHDAVTFVRALTEQRWETLAKMADVHRPEGQDHIHPPSSETRMAVLAVFRDRAADERRAAREGTEACDVAGAEPGGRP